MTQLLIDRLLEVGIARGSHPAVWFEGAPVSHQQLWSQAAYVDAALRRHGVGRGDRVALALEKSPSYLAALLGTWLAGAAFVPLSPQLPGPRQQTILAETASKVVISAVGDPAPSGPLHLALAGDEAAALEPRAPIGPDDLAYVLYTSGSTGRPKGIMVAHRGLLPLLEHQIRAFALSPTSRSLFYLSTTFDAAISDLGTALLAGATLVIERPERLVPGGPLTQTLAERGVTHWDLPPALLPHLSARELPPCLETLIIGGEPADPAAVRAFAERFRVVNVYGPTEATICTSLCVCGPDWSQPLLGDPIPGVRYQVMDERSQPSQEGELWISGPCLALGYLAQPELEATRFVHHQGERWYRTFDRVRARPDGRLVFVGRQDRQLKIDGVLVAPEEIEAALLQHPAVGGAAAAKDADGELTAWIEPRRQGGGLSEEALRRHLASLLPTALRPRRLVVVDRLPRGPAGKIDYPALKVPRPIAHPPPPSQAGLLATWVQVWASVLGTRPDPHDDLVELGADSLRALRATALLGAEGVVVSPALLALHPTVDAQLSAFLALAGAPDEGRLAQSLAEDVEGEVPSFVAAPRGEVGPTSRVLLTGGTGFLGAQLLARLLTVPALSITCVVRAPSEVQAAERLAQAAARQGLSWPRRPDRILLGDVGEPRLGLNAKRWADLSEEIDTILHLAGAISLTAPYERLRATNVGGAKAVAQLLATGRAKRLHYASTLSVFVGSDARPGVVAADAPLSLNARLYGGYAQSKWAAEHLLRRAAEAGEVTIHRLGLLVGAASSNQIPDRDLLAITIRGLAELGCAPEGLDLRFDVTPVDHAARVLLAVALSPGPTPRTLNVCSQEGATWAELVTAFERAGHPLQVLPRAVWQARARAHVQGGGSLDAGTAYWILARAAEHNRLGAFDLFQATGFRFEVEATERATGWVCPRLGPADLERYVRACLASGGPSPQTPLPPKGG